MNKVEFLKSMKAIAKAKDIQLRILCRKGEEGSVEHSILRVELDDANAIIEASKKGDNELLYAIGCIKGFTTSCSILDTCDGYTNSLK